MTRNTKCANWSGDFGNLDEVDVETEAVFRNLLPLKKEAKMGGYGSGRPRGGTLKWLVEECRVLDLNALTKRGLLDHKGMRSGQLSWPAVKYFPLELEWWPEETKAGYAIDTSKDVLALRYDYTPFDESSSEPGSTLITLSQSPLSWSRLRWWMHCPISQSGQRCGNRVSKLYLPPAVKRFGCRDCYQLTYQSCRDAHTNKSERDFTTKNGSYTDYMWLVREIKAEQQSADRRPQQKKLRQKRRKSLGWT